jgi:hypothetical protein
MSKHDEFPTKPDYEAKYKALEQAVKDAVHEISISEKGANGVVSYIAYRESLRILTEKTGITA